MEMTIARVHGVPALVIPGMFDLLRPIPHSAIQALGRVVRNASVTEAPAPRLLPATVTTRRSEPVEYATPRISCRIVVVRRKITGRIKFRVH